MNGKHMVEVIRAFKDGNAVKFTDKTGKETGLFRLKDGKLQHRMECYLNDVKQGKKWCDCHMSMQSFLDMSSKCEVKVLVPKSKE